MSFQKNKILSENIGVLDIGTSKIRIAICSIKNREIELLGYGEKRQNSDDVEMQEIQNIESVCENIALALKKAETEAGVSPDNLIINIPTPEIFLEHIDLNYVRESSTKINKKELYEIMEHLESRALKKHYKIIKSNSGYGENELKLIISNIGQITTDGIKSKKLLDTNPKEIGISLTNVFLPENKYETIEYIENFLQKKITQVIPTEYSLSHLFPDHSDMVMIDIGCSHTSVVVQRNYTIVGAKKLAFGMNDLIKKIHNNYNLSQTKIINQMDENIFLQEKANFLDIFHDILAISIEEMIGDDICPHQFFMSG
jgi:cell division ATPase FtsA